MPVLEASAFAGEAALLAPEVVAAVSRDLGVGADEYLARAAAAAAASAVVEGLVGQGIDAADARLEGTQLVVSVGDDAEASLVEAVGGVAEPIGEGADATTRAEIAYGGVRLEALADLVGGQPFQFSTMDGVRRVTYACSSAFNGTSSSGAAQFLTAGHCIAPGRLDGGRYFEARQPAAGANPLKGAVIGDPVESSFQFGSGADAGLVATASGWSPQPQVSTWGGARGAVTAGTPVTVRDVVPGIAGAPLCKSGRATGWTCGEILVTNFPTQVYDRQGAAVVVNLTLTSACMLAGDSGSASVIGSSAFGVGSAGSFSDCGPRADDEISAFFPLRTSDGSASVASTLTGWEPLVAVATPTVTAPFFVGDRFRGAVAGGGPRHRVTLTIDDSATLVATPAADGSWSIAVPSNLTSGSHSYTVRASWGSRSRSETVRGSYQLTKRPSVERLSGPDRYSGAVAISKRAFPGTAPVVFLATGTGYPDALSAAPAAVVEGGPLLLTQPDALPEATATELRRLQPGRIVVVGGPASVSDRLLAELSGYAATVERISGANRYEASRSVVETVFETSSRAYVATGANFPDALSASAAAGSLKAPVLLVDGGASAIDDPTRRVLDDLGASTAVIAGGPNSVSPGIEGSLRARGSVVRQDGPDRFAASVSVNAGAFTKSSTAYLATGYNYPDALAGGVLAGLKKAPLFVVPTGCVPQAVLGQLRTMGVTKVVLLGGPASLDAGVEGLVGCAS
jgi:putative cell wall-binding protein